MADLKYKPVPHNHKEFLANAVTRKGFSEAYKAFELEYQVAGQMLNARFACRSNARRSGRKDGHHQERNLPA